MGIRKAPGCLISGVDIVMPTSHPTSGMKALCCQVSPCRRMPQMTRAAPPDMASLSHWLLAWGVKALPSCHSPELNYPLIFRTPCEAGGGPHWTCVTALPPCLPDGTSFLPFHGCGSQGSFPLSLQHSNSTSERISPETQSVTLPAPQIKRPFCFRY